MVGGFNRLLGIMRTPYNQYDSMVRPLLKFLTERGVKFAYNTQVTDLGLADTADGTTVTYVDSVSKGIRSRLVVGEGDSVLLTLGCMTEASSLGSMEAAAALLAKPESGAWRLWEKLANGRPEFGRPWVFCNRIDRSKWISFTITLKDPTFLRLVADATGNVPGEGGLITFPDSSWLASIVIPYQPHVIGQPDDVTVLWGYGLSVEKMGDFINKPMQDCTGREIMVEILGHLNIVAEAPVILAAAICIPCMMPFITSQFMPREAGDRPEVLPSGSTNLAFMGQFCEIPKDVVFTVEYSIRSAQLAVNALLGLTKAPPPVYQGKFDPRVLFKAFTALHDATV
jgi:oleate hydratase